MDGAGEDWGGRRDPKLHRGRRRLRDPYRYEGRPH